MSTLRDLELSPGRMVGENHPTFIIAEIGQNHQGKKLQNALGSRYRYKGGPRYPYFIIRTNRPRYPYKGGPRYPYL